MSVDFGTLMEPVARRLLGEPNDRLSKPPKEWRFGTHGSTSINLETGQFFDHEAKVGGGVIELVQHKLRCSRSAAVDWLRSERHLPQQHTGLNSGHRIQCVYDYVDESGTLLYQVVRYRPKKFKQRRPGAANGQWIWNLRDIRRVPYRLPELIEAIGRGYTVYICEGEKDVENLVLYSFVATTNSGGAGNWLPEYSATFRDADVVIIPDNDQTGRDHANTIGGALIRIAKRIRVLNLSEKWPECPDKGDISDWLEAGGTAEKLNELVGALPDWAPPASVENLPAWKQKVFTAENLQSMEFSPIAWVVGDVIPAEGVTLLCSRPKFGKSWLVYDLCIGATMDRFILDKIKPAQGDVLYLALEDSKRRLQRRMTKLLPTFSGKWPEKLTITTEWRRLHEGGLDDIRSWYEHVKAKGGTPILAVIDVLAKVRKPTGNKPVYESDYEALTGLHRLAHELGIAIVVVHHTRKMAADDLMETVSGSYGLTGAVDTVIVMANKGGGAVLDVRGRDVEAAELAIQFNKNTCRWTILGAAAEVHQSDQRKAIIAALTERGEPMRISELMAATWMKRNPLELLLGKMVKAQSIKRTGSGHYVHKDYVEPPKPKEADKRKSVRSVLSVSPARQIADRAQATVNPQKSEDICPSVRSVRKFTSRANLPGSVAERVKSQTDQTDGQIEAQAIEEHAKSRSGALSGLGTVRTDQTDGHDAAPHDDLIIPPILDRRGEAIRICAQCGAGRPDDQPTIEIIGKHGEPLWVHQRGCLKVWEKENAKEL